MVPAIAGLTAEYEKKMAQARLEAHFGGPEQTLAATPDGVAALRHMMRAGEPRFIGGDAPAAGPTQEELDTLVGDPRLR